MSSVLQANIQLLEMLNKSSEDKRKVLLLHLTNNGIKTFSEMALNIMKGIVPITNREKLLLFTFKNTIKKIMQKRTSIKATRLLLIENFKLVKLLITPTLRYFTINQ
jgi:hypothetical protein